MMVIDSAKREDQLQNHPQQAETFESIRALIREVRQCQEAVQYRIVQQKLGQHVEHTDNMAEEASIRLKRIEKQLDQFPYHKNVGDKKLEREKLEREREAAEFERDLYRRIGSQYRSVGDAMAWQLYSFQSLPIYALGLNPSPGPISNSKKQGADREIEKVDEYWDLHQAFALRHDYTNLLRVWDLSIFYPNDPIAYIEEVKVQDSKVKSKQKRIGEIVAELVGKNEYIRPDGELFVHRKMVSQTPNGEIKTNIALLQKAIMQSLQEGVGNAANSYLSMVVANLTDYSAFPVSLLAEKWNQRTQESLFPDIWKVYCIDQLIATSRQKMAKPGFGVPYTVYPLPADFVSALVTGYFYVHYRLNTDAVVRALRDAGFEVKSFLADERTSGNQPIPDNKRLSYFQVKRGRIALTIHTLPVEQLLFDGLPLEEFVASIVAQCEAEEGKTENQMKSDQSEENVRRFHSMSTYTNMEKLWSISRWADS